LKSIAEFMYEMGQLKRVKRSGWWIAGISNPETVAEHSFRVAVLGWTLASLEGADPSRTMAMCLFHDTHEARTNDHHRVARRYVDWTPEVERRAASDQISRLPQVLADSLMSLIEEFEADETLEARIAHDADQLECLVQAREYQTQGFEDVQDWITNCQAALVTDSAKQLAEECLQVKPYEWWQGLKVLSNRAHQG